MTTQFQIAGKCPHCRYNYAYEGWKCDTAPEGVESPLADEPCDGTLMAQCKWRIDDGYEITSNTPSYFGKTFDQPEEW